jgi:threonine dehydratase
VTVHGQSWDDANKQAISIAREQGQIYVHPFDDRRMIAGAATIFTEIMSQINKVDLLVVSIGGGGLISGLLSAVKHFSPETRVIGVETIGADSMVQSVHAGRLVELPVISSIVTSLGARRPGKLTFDIVRDKVADLVTVTDKEAVAAAFELLEHEKFLVEPAASCCLAALTSGKIPIEKGEKVTVIICGANSSFPDLLKWGRDFSLDLASFVK